MIDVMMFLLVFFVLISTNVLPALGLHVSLPASGKPEHVASQKRVTFTLGADGQVYLDGILIGIDAVTDRLRGLQSPDTKLQVIIAGDKAANMQALVGVLDAVKGADVTSVAIITNTK